MIDPNDITKFERDDADLQEFFLFCCVVTGKNAMTQARLLDGFIASLPLAYPETRARHYTGPQTPFARIERALLDGTLDDIIKTSRLGQYNRLFGCFRDALDIDLRTCSRERLEAISGIGPKTSRFFLLHSRPHQRFAALDTHILKFLGDNGHKVPRATPSSKATYTNLEKIFLSMADAATMSVADFDLLIWKRYSKHESPL